MYVNVLFFINFIMFSLLSLLQVNRGNKSHISESERRFKFSLHSQNGRSYSIGRSHFEHSGSGVGCCPEFLTYVLVVPAN